MRNRADLGHAAYHHNLTRAIIHGFYIQQYPLFQLIEIEYSD